MSISIKSIGGSLNNSPKINDLKVTSFDANTIDIEYKVEDVELTICRHYLLLNEERVEITKEVGYESSTNIFKFTISKLKSNTNYTIQIAANDGIDESFSEAVNQKTLDLSLYGVAIDENNLNPESCCTYLEQAVGMQPAKSMYLNDWNNKWPFNKIRIVGFKDGKVVKQIKKEDKTKYIDGTVVPSTVDVMVEIPKIYWKFNSTGNKKYEIRIADKKIDSSYDCYAHKVNNIEKDFIYVGAYMASVEDRKLRSRSGATPAKKYTIDSFRSYAQANGNGYQQFNWFTMILLQILYIIAYKNLDSRTTIGKGMQQTYGATTGGTDTKGFIYGEQTGTEQMCFLGIEDLWGNLWTIVDGVLKMENEDIKIAKDYLSFENYSNYEFLFNMANVFSSSDYGYIKETLHTNKGGFLVTNAEGSWTSCYCCPVNFNARGSKSVLTFGGCSVGPGIDTGIFCLNGCMNYPNTNSDIVGTVLCYI